MRKPCFLILAALACPVWVPQALADTLLIERVQRESTVHMPRRGMLMPAVVTEFGEPTQRLDAVGGGSPHQPPIMRWVYPEFTVYFEHDHVVNAVVNRVHELEQGPKPVPSPQ